MAILYTNAREADFNQYANCVLKKEVDQSYRVMSDIWATADWALVWDDTENAPKKVLVNVYDMNPSDWKPAKIEVDATEEVRAKYLKWREEVEFRSLVDRAKDAALAIEKGCVAKVVRGRNGQGTVGKVVVVMNATYGMGWRASVERKLAIATSDVKVKKPLRNGKVAEVYKDVVWVWARNVTRVDIAEIDQEALRKEAHERAVRYCAAA